MGVEPLEGVIGESAGPVSMVNGHSVNGCKTVVVGEMQYHDVQDQRGVRGFDLVLWPKVQWNSILPLLKLFVQLADGVEKLTI